MRDIVGKGELRLAGGRGRVPVPTVRGSRHSRGRPRRSPDDEGPVQELLRASQQPALLGACIVLVVGVGKCITTVFPSI